MFLFTRDICQCMLQAQLLSATWLYRKIALILCAITLLCTYFYYKDEQLENYKALQRIEHQLDIIQNITTISNNIEPIRKYLIYFIIWFYNYIINCVLHPAGYSKRLALKRLHATSDKQEDTINIKNVESLRQ